MSSYIICFNDLCICIGIPKPFSLRVKLAAGFSLFCLKRYAFFVSKKVVLLTNTCICL